MTLIKGPSQTTIGQVRAWAQARGASDIFMGVINLAFQHAPRYDLRPEVVIVLADKESGGGWFGGVLNPSFHNWGGLKIYVGGSNYDPNAHQRFPSDEIGVIAVCQHLKAYLGEGPTTWPDQVYDKRWSVVGQPWISQIEELDGYLRASDGKFITRWAGPDYGTTLVSNYLNPLMATTIAPTPIPPTSGGTLIEVSPTQWGAKIDYDSKTASPGDWLSGVIHWGGTTKSTYNNGVEAEKKILRGWERYHRWVKFWKRGLAYNGGIGNSGTFYRIRNEQTNAANGRTVANRTKHAIVFIIGKGTKPSAAALTTYRRYYAERQWPLVEGHRDIKKTTCPGPELYAWLSAGEYKNGTTPPPTEEEDMLKHGDDTSGDQNNGDVGRLQDILALLGHNPGPRDGKYGSSNTHGTCGAVARAKAAYSYGGDGESCPDRLFASMAALNGDNSVKFEIAKLHP